MGLISLTLPNDGETVDAADVNTPFNTIATVINGNIENANIKSDAAIDGTKLADNSIPTTKMKGGAEGWTGVSSNPSTITYNGNRNYDLVFNAVDISNTVSPGMKLKLTRTVAAPTQCTDLELGSSQYYSRTSANLGSTMTFTDDFTVSAWVKLESYGGGTNPQVIASRYNGTSGWQFNVQSNGVVLLAGHNSGSSNISYIASYASLPLNKWVHVAAQLDMSTFTATTTTSYIMIDGVDVPAAVTRGGTNPTALIQAGNLEIGSANATNFFDGKIAQVAIYSAKVPQATIKASVNQTLSGSETSLISAYSFNGVITDLNTTNANNLTANNSAVATDTDSPYANAITAGLVQKVTYSTNTTVNVQVPEGCAVPTSGGISNVYYSVGRNPYGWISDRDRWNLYYLHYSVQTQTTPSNNVWYAFNSLAFVKPTGSFSIDASVLARLDGSTTDAKDMTVSFTNTGTSPTGPMQSSEYFFITYGTTIRKLFKLPIFTSNTTSASTYTCYIEFGGASLSAGGTYAYSVSGSNYAGTNITMTPTGL